MKRSARKRRQTKKARLRSTAEGGFGLVFFSDDCAKAGGWRRRAQRGARGAALGAPHYKTRPYHF